MIENISIEEAHKIIDAEKKARLEKFSEELKPLIEKYQVDILAEPFINNGIIDARIKIAAR